MQRKRLLYNKKGDLPIVILVIGVFVVCTLTLLNFYFEGFKDNNFFEGVVLVEKVREFSEELKFYDRLKLEDSLELSGLLEKIIDGNFEFEGNLIGRDYNLTGDLFEKSIWSEDKQLVRVEYNFPK